MAEMNNTSERSNITSGGFTNDDGIDCAEQKVLEAAKIGNVNLLDICVRQRRAVPFNIRVTMLLNGKTRLREQTLAHVGARTDHLNVVEWCLKLDRNFFLNSRDWYENTLLHAAVEGKGSLNMVDFIVSQNASMLYEENHYRQTVLDVATINGRTEIFVHLADQYHMPVNSTIALEAAQNKQVPMLTLILDREPSFAHSAVDSCGKTLLHYLARGPLDVIKLLCQKYGVQNRADCWGDFPIKYALDSYLAVDGDLPGQHVRYCHADYLQPRSLPPHDTSAHIAAREGLTVIFENLDAKKVSYQELRNDLGQTPIMLAVQAGHINTVRYLIDRGGAPLDFTDNAGNMILHYAACNPSLKVIQKLFRMQPLQIQLEARNKAGETCVFAAVTCDNLLVVSHLVEVKIHREIPLPEFDTLLMTAVKRDNWPIVKYLLDTPYAKPSLKEKYGNKVPDYLESEEMRNYFRINFPEMIFKSRTVVNTGDLMHLNCSDVVKRDDFGSLKNLLDVKMQPQGENVAHCAARADQLEMLKWLLEESTVDFLRHPDLLNNTILHAAAFSGSARVVDYIASRANSRDFLLQKNADGFNALHVAAAEGHEAVAKVLVDRWGMSPGIRTSIEENTAALVAAKHEHNDLLIWFLRKEPNIAAAVGECGLNVLNWITYHDNPAMADILCRVYAVRGSSNCYGEYPIHVAFRRRKYHLAQVLADACQEDLLKQRSNPPRDTTAHDAARLGILDNLIFLNVRGKRECLEMKNDFGQTPIFVAAENNRIDIVKHYVQKSPSYSMMRADGTDIEGNTILHQIACHSDLEILKYLMEQVYMLEYRLMEKNKAGQTVIYKAVMCDNLELIKYLHSRYDSRTDFNTPASDNTTAFHAAIMRDNYKIVDYMLEIGVGQEVPVSEGVKEPWEYAKTERMRENVQRKIMYRRLPTPRVLQKREVRMVDRLDYSRLETSTESITVSIPEIGLIGNTLLLLDTILKKIFGRKSDYGSNISDLPPSPPEILRSKIDPLALEAIYQAERFEGLTDDDESDG